MGNNYSAMDSPKKKIKFILGCTHDEEKKELKFYYERLKHIAVLHK